MTISMSQSIRADGSGGSLIHGVRLADSLAKALGLPQAPSDDQHKRQAAPPRASLR